MVTLNHYLVLSAILFAIGTAGVFVRRNLITILLSIEIMLNAVNLTFVAFGRALGSADGQIIVFFVMTVAAAEAAVGLAIVISLFRHKESPEPGFLREPEVVRRHNVQRRNREPAETMSSACSASSALIVVRCMLLLIPLLPFVGFLLNASLGKRLSKSASGAIACGAILMSFLISIAAVWRLVGLEPESRAIVNQVFTWIASGDFTAAFTLRLDPLSSVMILVITGIGSLIHIYSTAYMHEESDSEYARYFSYLNLFAAFMLVLVLGANFLVMFVGWEGVGLCSYLLDRLLVSEEVGRRRRQEGVHRQSHRRLRVRPRRAAAVRPLRHASTSRRSRAPRRR